MDDKREEITEQTEISKASDYRASAQAHKEALKRFWVSFGTTGIIMLIVAILAVWVGFGWFVANNRVQSGAGSVSATHDVVRLATAGERQTAEQELMGLETGTAGIYDGMTYYWTEGGTIALRLSEEHAVYPGASGNLTFYIIPTRDGAATVTLHLGLKGYIYDDQDNTVKLINDDVLNTLLSGHILMFSNYTEGHYSDWLLNPSGNGVMDNVITVTLPNDAQKDVPVPVHLYWIWPLRYENMVQDLYSEGSEEYTSVFAPFIENQAIFEDMTSIEGGYRYSCIFLTNKELHTVADRTKAYNLADEYIGTNANYLYLTIQTSDSFEGSGKEQS